MTGKALQIARLTGCLYGLSGMYQDLASGHCEIISGFSGKCHKCCRFYFQLSGFLSWFMSQMWTAGFGHGLLDNTQSCKLY